MPPEATETRSEQMNFRATPSLRRTLEAMAAEEDRSLSQMIQRLLDEAIAVRQEGTR
jgi:predicted HicB family RNase H-like nuclease